MAQKEFLTAKLKNFLREDKIQLWKPPYTNENKKVGVELKELAQKFSTKLELSEVEVESLLEEIRCKAIERGTGNDAFKRTGIATLEVSLAGNKGKAKRKNSLETKLIITGKELRSQIAQTFGLQENRLKIIANKKILDLGKTLEEQGITHNVRVMVLELMHSQEETKRKVQEEEKQKEEDALKEKEIKDRLKRTKKGLEILAEREDYLDPDTTPYLDIANQTGKTIKIPPRAKKALVLAMGYHEKGRALMKKNEYEVALPFLLDADKHFCECGTDLLNTVDNYAVLQLDIVWCYFRLEQLECLDDAEKKLATAQNCFKRCYGENHERLFVIKGSLGSEKVLFLRLYLLQGIGHFHNGKEKDAAKYLKKAYDLFQELFIDPEKVNCLLLLGFSPQEARLGLRATSGDVDRAADLISNRRETKAEIRREERKKRRQRLEDINTLKNMGYSERAAQKALHQANGNLDNAFQILVSNPQLFLENDNNNPVTMNQFQVPKESIDQLVYMGFDRESAEEALKVFQGNIQLAAQTLARNGGVLPTELQLLSEATTPSEESTSSKDSPTESAGTSSSSTDEDMEVDAVNEILEDIPEHEEDYLDLTLEEEGSIIDKYLSYIQIPQP
ncbi:NEDD8 ultimate buster 1 [Alligator mississippiensis]|nr:NEDD8 ultimate buster 1 [Alligator mississippiensis]XP_014464565.1 NEDD8 ultimate buster 1 [Alligator mississippiensis]XP_019354691.1 NEDD8 ultimate buster 1 [Alligator mississippiensis]XP_019354695.1 NEDD8 ultimate buster 1 [Alligator mississippiensis]XP_059585200.1 NEDD8 ultimate buster 1 [Alligator mississippiensis]XP_059585201.1 NEDD8 ultimate buster 1 [Alligator mississippiensis]